MTEDKTPDLPPFSDDNRFEEEPVDSSPRFADQEPETAAEQPKEPALPDLSDEDDFSALRSEYKEHFGLTRFEEEFDDKKFFSLRWHMVALSIFVGVLLVILAGFLFMGDEQSASGELITITAPTDPVKVQPAEPGGTYIPDQDKMIYDRIRSDKVSTRIEKLFPAPEKPVVPKTLVLASEKEPAESVEKTPVAEFDALEAAPALPADVTVRLKSVPDVPALQPKKEVVTLKEASVSKTSESSEENRSEKVVSAKTTSNKVAAGAAEEVWRIQLMSSSKKKTVDQAWTRISTKHKKLLSNMGHTVTKAEISGRGTFYRLQAGQFPSKEKAAALCRKLKDAGQDCVPVK